MQTDSLPADLLVSTDGRVPTHRGKKGDRGDGGDGGGGAGPVVQASPRQPEVQ